MHILEKKNKESKKPVPRCLVLSPTRELAQQVKLGHTISPFCTFAQNLDGKLTNNDRYQMY
jgi:superfamily II DNA/RNA helicase